MAGCSPQVFPNIDPATFAMMQTRGAAAGFPISGDTGQATTMGVTLRWHYDPTAQTLVVECTHAPFFVPCSTITSKVQELVDSCRPHAV